MAFINLFRKKTKLEDKMYLYTEEELEKYKQFVEEQFGNYEEILHEVVSDGIHLDIIVIPPTKEDNYYKLVTMGMGAYKMNVPKNLKKYKLERSELVIFLPPNWDIKSNKEEDYWPIRQLKTLARLPIQSNTWLGYGHTVSSDYENTPYAKNTKFCSMLLLLVPNKNNEPIEMNFNNNEIINFYQLFPLHKEELLYIQRNGHESFPISKKDVMPLNMKRKSYFIIKK